MGKLVDLTGQRFGRLLVVERAGSTHLKKATWLCRCDCGTVFVAIGNNLMTGNTRSCGCLDRETNSIIHTRHGGNRPGKRERLYSVWLNIKARCEIPNRWDYKYYGGRGIKVCEKWRSDYGAFREWAYSTGYDDAAAFGKCTIDRIDVNGDYEPDNCRWADMKTQRNNRRPRSIGVTV